MKVPGHYDYISRSILPYTMEQKISEGLSKTLESVPGDWRQIYIESPVGELAGPHVVEARHCDGNRLVVLVSTDFGIQDESLQGKMGYNITILDETGIYRYLGIPTLDEAERLYDAGCRGTPLGDAGGARYSYPKDKGRH